MGKASAVIDQEDHPILSRWLWGTTCSRWVVKRSILFENDDYIVLKHNAHSEYLGRMSGSSCCQSYAKLYRKSDMLDRDNYNRKLQTGYDEMKRWDGRISKTKVRDECRDMGIIFE